MSALESPTPPQKRQRGPGFSSGALTLAILLVLATVALTARQPPLPTIAEFAPQAVQQIEDAPPEQAGDTGAPGGGPGGGGAPGGGPEPTTTTALETTTPEVFIDVPRVRRCIGDPPRQIEDPQSPPCVPYWDPSNDNGGATFQGVTATEIRIAIPDWGQSNNDRLFTGLENFFNNRFEFYGRKLRFFPVADGSPEARAVEIDEQIEAFASSSFPGYQTAAYYDAVASREIISVTAPHPYLTTEHMAARRPYQWSYTMAADEILSAAGDWVCRRFAGQPSRFAGPTEQADKRVFGAILDQVHEGQNLDFAPLEQALARCGETLTEKIQYTGFPPEGTYANYMLQMRSAGVTTLFCFCYASPNTTVAMTAATQVNYFPEWLLNSYIVNDVNFFARQNPTEQAQAMLAQTSLPKQVAIENRPAYWAIREVDPTYTSSQAAAQGSLETVELEVNYQPLLLLASGIQMAGPNLTPETFERALHQTVFPNPTTSLMSGTVGFQGDYSMTDDLAEMWWSPTARGPQDDESGAYCYVAGGARHRDNTGPTGDDDFFGQNPCDTGRTTTYDGG